MVVFSFISSLFSTKSKLQIQAFLKLLWFSQRLDWIDSQISELMKIEPTAPVMFLCALTESNVTTLTQSIIRNLLIKYPKPEYGVCLQVSKMLGEGTFVGAACAQAIGIEKSPYNKEFYHKIRVLKTMEQGQWRKFLIAVKSHMDNFKPSLFTKTIDYTCGLFNEPLDYTCKNPSHTCEILSLYKGRIYKNKLMRTPIEIPLDIPFTQKDFHLLVEMTGNEPIVIVTKHIGQDVIVPKNFHLVFIDSTASYGERIYPFIGESATWNLLDLI